MQPTPRVSSVPMSADTQSPSVPLTPDGDIEADGGSTATPAGMHSRGSGIRETAADVDAIQLRFSSGNITSGE